MYYTKCIPSIHSAIRVLENKLQVVCINYGWKLGDKGFPITLHYYPLSLKFDVNKGFALKASNAVE
jgi:hypothetical protein